MKSGARLDAAIALREPDRVPFAPKVSLFYCMNYGVNVYDVMKDTRNAVPAITAYAEEFDPDLVWPPTLPTIDPLEALGAGMLKWPGPRHGLSLNSSYQHLDNTYMEDDEFGAFLADPTGFIVAKVLPRKYSELAGLSKVALNDIYDSAFINRLSVFSEPDVLGALMALAHAGRHVADKAQQGAYIQDYIKNTLQCPTWAATLCAPFDIYADSLRGLIKSVTDLRRHPGECLACVERIAELTIERNVAAAKARGAKLILIPLHAGTDTFMSRANYEKFYWPTLKRLIEAIAEAGMVPYVFCEGGYDTRLEVISDVPKGKVIYMFEQVDFAQAKKTVGKVACVGANMPTELLILGTRRRWLRRPASFWKSARRGAGFSWTARSLSTTPTPKT